MNYPISQPQRPRFNYDKPERNTDKVQRLAWLLNADFININALPSFISKLQACGQPIIKRFYTTSADHLATLEQHGFQIQLFPKNQTLTPQIIIDALDLIHHKQIDGLVLCANDPLQSALAYRAKASNVRVFGLSGHDEAGFGAVCDQLFKTEVQSALPKSFETAPRPASTPAPLFETPRMERETPHVEQPKGLPEWKPAHLRPPKINSPSRDPFAAEVEAEEDFINHEDAAPIVNKRMIRSLPMRTMVYKAIRDCAEADGWALTTKIGSYIRYLQPDFDYKLLGYPKLSDFLRAIPGLQLRHESTTRLFCRKIDYAPLLNLLDQAMHEYQDSSGWADIDDVEDFIADDWSYQDYGFESFRSLLDTVVGAEVDDVNHLMRYTRTTRYTS